MKVNIEKIGKDIHLILNETLFRKLEKREYQKLVQLIAILSEDAWKYNDLQD